jgi:mono/diheme cytochrome c family protein
MFLATGLLCIALVEIGADTRQRADVPPAAMQAQLSGQTPPSGGNSEHGRYVAESVAMCIQCHSPRDGRGNLLPDQSFHGAPIPLRPPWMESDWAIYAPRIAGMPGYTLEQGVKLLTEGISRNNARLKPPMPQFRMTPQDAADVVAFLKSLEWR